MAAAGYYMPKGVPVKNVGYWFPADGRGPVANDTNVVLQLGDQPGARARVPQLLPRPAERAEQHQLQRLHAAADRRDPAGAGQGGDLPKPLLSTVVLPSYFRRGVAELQLPVDADALWQQAWLVVSNGL